MWKSEGNPECTAVCTVVLRLLLCHSCVKVVSQLCHNYDIVVFSILILSPDLM